MLRKRKRVQKEMLEQYSKDELMRIREFNFSLTLAHYLAFNGKHYTNDKDILKLRDIHGDTVAHYLAMHNPIWQTNDKEILMLANNEGNTVAHNLAKYKRNWQTNDEEILKLKNNKSDAVAYYLALINNTWRTYKYNILMMQNYKGNYVVHALVKNNKDFIISTRTKKGIELLKLRKYNDESTAESYIYFNPLFVPYNNEILEISCKPYTIRNCLAMNHKIIATTYKKNVITIIPII